MQNKYLFNYKRLHLPGGEPMNKMAVYTSCFVPLSPIFVGFPSDRKHGTASLMRDTLTPCLDLSSGVSVMSATESV